FILELGGEAQFGGAHRGEIRRMREQDAPAVAQPMVEPDQTLAGVLFKVGGDIAKADAHVAVLLGTLRGEHYAQFFFKSKRINNDLSIHFRSIKRPSSRAG